VLGLLQEERGAEVSGSIRFVAEEIAAGGAFVREARGRRLSMIFQDPASSLNPTFTILDQFREVLRRAEPRPSGAAAFGKARQWLADVSMREPERVLASYVFQLSGGMSQRVMIAMALANGPALLIADEPGTALDVSVQAQTLRLMDDLTSRLGTAVLFISHNLGVVREFADRVYVIYRGEIVEHGETAQLFGDPRHPYTRALLAAVPKISRAGLPDLPETSPEFSNPRIDHPGCGEPIVGT
jgi:ABC-type dipeptide/oligopeptide/nickel transport system ATPase component